MNEIDFDNNIEIWKYLFDIDDKTIEALSADSIKGVKAVDYKYNRLTVLAGKPWFIRLISNVERLLSPKLSKNYKLDDEDFIMIASYDGFNRVKTLPLIAGKFKYKVFFLPTITRPMHVRGFYNFYKNAEMDVFFGTFPNHVIKEYSNFLKRNKKLFSDIKCEDKESEKILRYMMKRFAIYSIYAKEIFKHASNEKLWIFEQDKFYFIPVINEFRKKGVMTVELQHGTFFNPTTDFRLPLYVDKMICCSEREKCLYRDGGVDMKDIYVTGAPLQTLHEKKDAEGSIIFDLLVLLTDATRTHIDRQIITLTYINEHFKDKRILIRFRPKSALRDKEILAKYVKGYSISTGTSLMEDLSSSERVVTLSEDSIFSIIQARKPFIAFVNKSDLYGGYLDGLCHTTDDIEECLTKLFSKDYSTDIDKYIYAFGETDINVVKNRFEKVLYELKDLKDSFNQD